MFNRAFLITVLVWIVGTGASARSTAQDSRIALASPYEETLFKVVEEIVGDEDQLKEVFRAFELDDSGLSRLPELPNPVCVACEIFFGLIIESVQNGGNFSAYIEIAIDICINLGIGNDVFCEDFLHLIEPELEFVFTNTTNLTGNDFCGMFLVGEGCVSDNPDRKWSLNINGSKPEPYDPPYDDNVPTLKVLHLADTHYDPEYLPESNAMCPELYLCCRASSGEPEKPEDAAGFWGDYRECDAPKWLLEATYQDALANHPDIDFIIWTGDLVSHDLWSTSREGNLETIRETADMISTHLPGIQTYPTLGNHEGNPVNSFPQPYIGEPFNISWLYTEVEQVWSRWLGEDASETLLYGGYYAKMIKPGLKLISVNSNFCYGYNWWLVVDDHDVAQTLQFMADELQKSENAGESAYLIMHISPGSSSCHFSWSHEYNRIVNRYENTISGIFFGHTHNDHFQLFLDVNTLDRVYDVAYIGQSQTPYSELNPGYKIYTIEGEFEGSRYRVLDFESWVLDLDTANVFNISKFYKLYSAKDEYSLTDLSPQSWYDLVLIMNQPDSVLFDHFYRNYVKDSRLKLEGGCDADCKYDKLCDLLTSDNSHRTTCDVLTAPPPSLQGKAWRVPHATP